MLVGAKYEMKIPQQDQEKNLMLFKNNMPKDEINSDLLFRKRYRKMYVRFFTVRPTAVLLPLPLWVLKEGKINECTKLTYSLTDKNH
ncbi:CLUMA_CG004215, isoform A [Clunio marinus]|uniref:CLUMA_CG004215, isoform A n=1 Tax=Clunio marinus TaxID=568069 RepID=A0A1J1HQX8_9DIPT|nr:CLUMA_CG004215, isoform A [Clunio marinus]